ncbi:MAG: hypothetical protein ACE5GX_17355 [Thermoanaerobaculia bacterium]
MMAKTVQGGSPYSKAEEAGEFVTLDDKRDVGIPLQVFKDEVAAIRDRRAHENLAQPGVPDDGKPSAALGLKGLSISGGGIRSATFSTGVMQALAAKNVLKHMDYLSTVSGGGYSGSSLTWALYGNVYDEGDDIKDFIQTFGTGPSSFPTTTDDPAAPRQKTTDKRYGFRLKLLNYLREHGNYLTPGGGITALSALAVLLRGILLNLIVWVGLVSCLFLIALLYFDPSLAATWPNWLPAAWVGAWAAAIVVVGLVGKRFPIWLVAVALAGLGVIVTWQEAGSGAGVFRTIPPTIWLLLTGVAVCVLYGVLTFFAGILGEPNRRYGYRRFIEHAANPYFIVTIFALTLGTLGMVYDALRSLVEETSLAMIASGIASGFWTFAKSGSDKDEESKIPIGLVATVGSLLLLYGGLLGAYALAEWASGSYGQYVWYALGAVLVMGWVVNTNYISLGRYYRDRLMETFMPPIDRALNDETGSAQGADRTPLSKMWGKGEDARGPYHIVNTNLVLVDSERRTWRTRGGDSFILSPFYCGSTATGWRRTELFERNTMTLATAMAISAAAANPNAGVGGKGLSRSKFVSLLMALLNFRLGSWVRNCNSPRMFPPNHFWPGGAYELLGGFKETSNWLTLSDGGHFENLALYEMIRRRLKLIVVLDGGADPDFNFADLQNAMRRIGADFGARLDFSLPEPEDESEDEEDDEEKGPLHPLRVLSYKREKKEGFFPLYPGRADRGWAHAKIRYKGWSAARDDNSAFEGDLVYVKTTLVPGLSITTEGYRDANPTFPDQSTADQFFDAEQFEAYRDLGYRIGVEAASAIRKCL